MWEILALLLLIVTLTVFLAPRFLGSGAASDSVNGTLLVTGVSPRPDATGEQFVTIAGVINGPTVDEHTVYGRMAVDVDDWPATGQLLPVVYSRRNPDKWRMSPPDPRAG
ncbi:hypothetical protein [Mycobacterium sp.]|uniref:hypothetical protein n=1 Tax=Mycobacterium sp. TaxID=1785 RepID=UPI0031D5082E